jgi:hypothetical protein
MSPGVKSFYLLRAQRPLLDFSHALTLSMHARCRDTRFVRSINEQLRWRGQWSDLFEKFLFGRQRLVGIFRPGRVECLLSRGKADMIFCGAKVCF